MAHIAARFSTPLLFHTLTPAEGSAEWFTSLHAMSEVDRGEVALAPLQVFTRLRYLADTKQTVSVRGSECLR